MPRKLFLNYCGFIVTLFLLWSTGARAQITITSGNILGLIGKSQTVESDTTDAITVNLGTAGTNRTWDFRTLVLRAERFTYQFIAPSGTPFAARVPQANFVQRATIPSQPSSAFYVYSLVSATGFRSLGVGVVSPQGNFFSFANAQDLAPLPLAFNSTWTSVESDTTGNIQTGASISTSTTVNTVDAWGVVRLSIGDFNCLRIRENNTTISKIVVGNITLNPDTSKTIDYSWVSQTDFLVASVSSRDGETNPNYTTATSFTRLFSRATSVASPHAAENIPTDFALAQNFPNPFNPATEIAFQIARAGHAELSIYNIAGEKVRTLISGNVAPGNHSVKWDGKNEGGRRLASGTYVYRLKAGNFSEAKKCCCYSKRALGKPLTGHFEAFNAVISTALSDRSATHCCCASRQPFVFKSNLIFCDNLLN